MPHPNPRMKNTSSAPRERRHRARRRWRWHATNLLAHHTWERRNALGERVDSRALNYQRQLQYDAFGRPWKTQDASQYWQKTEYDAQGFAVAQCESTQGDFTAQCQYPASTWQRITAVNARGQTTAETRGGQAALSITRSYDALTGRLTGQCVGIGCALLDEGYAWDELGNLEYRLKAGQYKEEFQYDSLNRLTQGRFTQLLDLPAAVTSLQITYDALGNLCQKSDLRGTLEYTYGQDAGCGTGGLPGGHSGAGGPQTLAQVESTPGGGKGGSPVLETYVHDAHGNQTQRSAQTVNRNVRYSASQDAYEITLASMFGTPPRSRFWYGPGGRYKREDSAQGSSTRRTVYLGNVEIITQGGQVQIKRYLVGGLAVQTFDGGLFGRPVTRYLYHDHLGSIVRVADANGALVEGADYGPFGERRGFAHPTGIPAIPETTNKGFTGHEMLDGLDIVHMNGRLYDNRLYRFMQPDPFVQSPGTPQNWNPYSYLWNNPLNGTDPSGYLGVKERQWLGAIITIVAAVTQNWWAVKWGLSATQVAWVYVAVGGVSGGVSSGSWNGALWGAFSAAVMAGAGSQFGGLSAPKRFFSMGMAGGVMSSLQGGKFGHGFVSADKRRADFQALLRADLETSRAWAAKETLRRTWQQPTVEAAREHVTAWLKHVADSLQGPMHAFSLLVWEKLEPIIRYCAHPITTGKAEGINSKLMAIQRSARGYRSHASFRIAALFHCGGLSLYPAA